MTLTFTDILGHLDQLVSHDSSFTFQTTVENHRVVAKFLGLSGRDVKRLVVVTDESVHTLLENRAVLLRSFLDSTLAASGNLVLDTILNRIKNAYPLESLSQIPYLSMMFLQSWKEV